MSISRNDSRNLSALASRAGATVLGGQLSRVEGRFFINKMDVTALLEAQVGRNVVLIVEAVTEEPEAPNKTCLTCGRDYVGTECPHCANARGRLRR